MASCKHKPEEYYIKRIDYGLMQIYTSKVIIEKESTGNLIKLTYRTVLDTVSYLFSKNDKRNSQLVSSYYEAPTFKLVKEYSITSGNKNYNIFQFSTFDGTIDSGSEHYWNEELGVFFTRGKTWPIYHVLQSTDEKKNKIIWRIIKDVYPPIKERMDYIDLLVKDGAIEIKQVK